MKINRMNFEGKDSTIEEFYDMYEKNRLNFEPEYQREEVWKPIDKQTLIDSILTGNLIGSLLLHRNKSGMLDVVDGQQRLKAIFGFIEGDFKTNAQISGEKPISFENIKNGNREDWKDFLGYKIPNTIISDADDETIAEFFIRINSGSTLTASEKLHAQPSYMNKRYIQQWVKHPFFKKSGIPNKRSNLETNLIRLVRMILSADFLKEDVIIPGDSYESHRRFLIKYRYKDENFPTAVCNKIKKTLDLMEEDFNGIYKIYNGGIRYFLTFFVLFYVVNSKQFINIPSKDEKQMFIINFVEQIESLKIKMSSTDWKPNPFEMKYFPYAQAVSNGGGIAYLNSAIRSLLDLFFEEFDQIESKDPQRGFKHPQKLAIYSKSEGVCCSCGTTVPFDEGEFDHIKMHAQGGKTNVANGQLLCYECHREKTLTDIADMNRDG